MIAFNHITKFRKKHHPTSFDQPPCVQAKLKLNGRDTECGPWVDFVKRTLLADLLRISGDAENFGPNPAGKKVRFEIYTSRRLPSVKEEPRQAGDLFLYTLGSETLGKITKPNKENHHLVEGKLRTREYPNMDTFRKDLESRDVAQIVARTSDKDAAANSHVISITNLRNARFR